MLHEIEVRIHLDHKPTVKIKVEAQTREQAYDLVDDAADGGLLDAMVQAAVIYAADIHTSDYYPVRKTNGTIK